MCRDRETGGFKTRETKVCRDRETGGFKTKMCRDRETDGFKTERQRCAEAETMNLANLSKLISCVLMSLVFNLNVKCTCQRLN